MSTAHLRHGFLHGEPVVYVSPVYEIPYYGIVDLDLPCADPYVPVRFVGIGSGGWSPQDLQHLLPGVLRPDYSQQRRRPERECVA